MTQDQAWAAIELQEMWLVAQPLETKVSGVAKLPPRWLKCYSHRWAPWPIHLGTCLPGTHPQTFQLAAH